MFSRLNPKYLNLSLGLLALNVHWRATVASKVAPFQLLVNYNLSELD